MVQFLSRYFQRNFRRKITKLCIIASLRLNARINSLYMNFVGEWSSLQVQGDPNQNLLFQLALHLNISVSDPMFIKPKCV